MSFTCQTISAAVLLEGAEAERARDRGVDPAQLAHRARVLADVDTYRDTVRGGAPDPLEDRRRLPLRTAGDLCADPPSGLASGERLDEPVRQVPTRAFTSLERHCNRVDDSGPTRVFPGLSSSPPRGGPTTGAGHAKGAGVLCRRAVHTHDADLALIGTRIRSRRPVERVLRTPALL